VSGRVGFSKTGGTKYFAEKNGCIRRMDQRPTDHATLFSKKGFKFNRMYHIAYVVGVL